MPPPDFRRESKPKGLSTVDTLNLSIAAKSGSIRLKRLHYARDIEVRSAAALLSR